MNTEQKGERRRRRAWWLGVLLGVVAVPFVGCLGTCLRPMWAPAWPELASHLNPTQSDFDPPPAPFNQRKWQRGYSSDRIAIGKTLAGSGTLVGMSRDQVEAMLGSADRQHGWDKGTDRDLWWNLGTVNDGLFFGWEVKLIVNFDESGLVSRAKLYWAD